MIIFLCGPLWVPRLCPFLNIPRESFWLKLFTHFSKSTLWFSVLCLIFCDKVRLGDYSPHSVLALVVSERIYWVLFNSKQGLYIESCVPFLATVIIINTNITCLSVWICLVLALCDVHQTHTVVRTRLLTVVRAWLLTVVRALLLTVVRAWLLTVVRAWLLTVVRAWLLTVVRTQLLTVVRARLLTVVRAWLLTVVRAWLLTRTW